MKSNKLFLSLLFLSFISGCDAKNINNSTITNVKTTLEGIDKNSNGIRDDVEKIIYNRYPNDKVKQKSLIQMAEALQKVIIKRNTQDKNTINELSKSVIIATDCLTKTMKNPMFEIRFIEQKTFNTTERMNTYINFNQSLSGQFFGEYDDVKDPCK